jgi:hypothetical protein
MALQVSNLGVAGVEPVWSKPVTLLAHEAGIPQVITNKMFQNVSKCFKMFQNVSKCFKMFQNVSKCFKMVQNGSKWFKMVQNGSK